MPEFCAFRKLHQPSNLKKRQRRKIKEEFEKKEEERSLEKNKDQRSKTLFIHIGPLDEHDGTLAV